MVTSKTRVYRFIVSAGISLGFLTSCAVSPQDGITRLLKTQQCIRCDLSQVDFTKVDLHGQKQKPAVIKITDPLTQVPIPTSFVRTEPQGPYLARINLQGSRISGESGAKLARANFYQANLSEVNLYKADLFRANLAYTDLSKAILYQANLEEVNLEGANLRKAVLIGANLKNADLSNANFENADLSGATWINGQRCQHPSIGKCLHSLHETNVNVSR